MSVSITAAARLNYSWSHLNVYSTDQNAPTSTCQKIRNCFPDCWRSLQPASSKQIPADAVQLLYNVSGIARAGELLAIMGSSGAGKTTLLNALAFRSAADIRVDGATSLRALNHVAVTAQTLRPHCAYVEQHDMFLGSLSTIEHLRYQAELRLRCDWTAAQRRVRVAEVMMELSLESCANTRIGEPGGAKGLSGGELKRLSVATALLSNPALMLCDEPTSGLDSFMSRSVVEQLHKLADSHGRTILITIHQPSSEIVAMFDKLLLMAAGRVAFFGAPAAALKFFADIGAPCPPNHAATEHYVQVLGIRPGFEDEDRERVSRICDTFAVGPMGKQIQRDVTKVDRRASSVQGMDAQMDVYNKYRVSWYRQCFILYRRAGWGLLMRTDYIKARVLTTIV